MVGVLIVIVPSIVLYPEIGKRIECLCDKTFLPHLLLTYRYANKETQCATESPTLSVRVRREETVM